MFIAWDSFGNAQAGVVGGEEIHPRCHIGLFVRLLKWVWLIYVASPWPFKVWPGPVLCISIASAFFHARLVATLYLTFKPTLCIDVQHSLKWLVYDTHTFSLAWSDWPMICTHTHTHYDTHTHTHTLVHVHAHTTSHPYTRTVTSPVETGLVQTLTFWAILCYGVHTLRFFALPLKVGCVYGTGTGTGILFLQYCHILYH